MAAPFASAPPRGVPAEEEARRGTIRCSSSDAQRVRTHASMRGTAEEIHMWRTTGQWNAEGGNTSLVLVPWMGEAEGGGEESCREARGGMRSQGVSASASSSGEGENLLISDLRDCNKAQKRG